MMRGFDHPDKKDSYMSGTYCIKEWEPISNISRLIFRVFVHHRHRMYKVSIAVALKMKRKMRAYAKKCVVAGAHLPTARLFAPAKTPRR